MKLTVKQLAYLKELLIDKTEEHDELAEFEELAVCKELVLKVEEEMFKKNEEK